MTILVIGGSGYLGHEIVRQSTAAGHRVTATFLTRRPEVGGAEWLPLDVRDRRHVAETMAAVRPDAVLNSAYRQDDWTSTADGDGRPCDGDDGEGSWLQRPTPATPCPGAGVAGRDVVDT